VPRAFRTTRWRHDTLLDRLQAKNLISRARCTHDRASDYLELTDEGRAAFPRMREISMSVLKSLSARLYQDGSTRAGGLSRPHARERAELKRGT